MLFEFIVWQVLEILFLLLYALIRIIQLEICVLEPPPRPQFFKCVFQLMPFLFPSTAIICCFVLVILHAKLCFQFCTTLKKKRN